MSKCFKEVARVPVCLEKGRKYQVELVGNEVVISKETTSPMWTDVTKCCHLEFINSQHCDGRYIAVIYKAGRDEKRAAIIGKAGIQPQHDFKVEKPAGAYTSFKVYMKNKERK